MLSRRTIAGALLGASLTSLTRRAAAVGVDAEPPPRLITADTYTAMPEVLRRKNAASEWSAVNKAGQPPVDSFIEGLVAEADGTLYCVDIPFGRLFRIAPDRTWTQLAEWDGEPNGMTRHPDGPFFIADYKQGLLTFDPATGKIATFLGRRDSERFKGLNDLTFALNGDLYFTDQGQTGLQDPTGRVYRLRLDGRLDTILATGVSPNGLVLHPNEQVLFVSMTRDNAVWRVPLFPDGSTGKVGRFVSFHGVSGPDSLTIDAEGTLLVPHASLGSVFAVDPDGEIVARIRAPRGKTVTNAKLGGTDRKMLFFTESSTGTILTAPWSVPARRQYADKA
ncbi:SMP-30/gluconolactonase/LRE family protein [Methylobacterium sp. J-070]|uniref:SMP-30/gluconolactonase/LRE family protein n=1 Tax=Methylobacterium sp. J-070 TaxID=2836650 RepID=UPI0028C3DE40|nr:SMP-30/gluconolactonase/LRE family protein [Methylobacterium sp. J-070]